MKALQQTEEKVFWLCPKNT